jgi:SNF2 family DNA or RNA helicase
VDRAHRIGQTRPVDVSRLIIDNTVEQRILALQEMKSALADGAMGEGTGGRLGRLSVRDLMKLFNYNDE